MVPASRSAAASACTAGRRNSRRAAREVSDLLVDRWGTIRGSALHESSAEAELAAEPEPFAEPQPFAEPEPSAVAPPAPSTATPAARPPPAPLARRSGGVAGATSRITEAVAGLLRRSRAGREETVVQEMAGVADDEEYKYLNAYSDDFPAMAAAVELPERVLNIAVTDPTRRLLANTRTLNPASDYLVRIDIGLQAEESVVVNPTPIPVEQLEPTSPEGFWFEVVVASADVDVAAELHRVFLPFVGASFVCGCTGAEHLCTDRERQPFLYVPIRTRAVSGEMMVRCIVYDRNNVVQTARLQVRVADGAEQPDAIHAVIDYTLASRFEDAELLAPRRLNILTNESGDGTHKIVVKNAERAIAVDLSEQEATNVLHELRAKLKEITLGASGKASQYDEENRKDTAGFVSDLTQLAALGSLLWGVVVPSRDDRLQLREQLAGRTTIQVARVTKVVFPWALVYDIPHELASGWTLCPLLDEWASNRGQLSTYPDRCPHVEAHRANVLCPYGFWGFRHLIEQPPSVRAGALRTRIRVTKPAQAGFVRSLQLNQALTTTHLSDFQGCLGPRFELADCDSRDDLRALFAEPALPLIYFYCHGKSALIAGTQLEVPFLEIGSDEMIGPNDFSAWDEDGNWGPAHWSDVAPLVFINGCQTTALSPEDIVSFVEALAGMNAAGVIGTEIPVTQQLAGEVATAVLSAVRRRNERNRRHVALPDTHRPTAKRKHQRPCLHAVLLNGSRARPGRLTQTPRTDREEKDMPSASDVGAVLFGVVVGWITYRTLVRRTDGVALSDIATVIGAVGGGAVVVHFNNPHLFGLYSIGLAAGFFAYLLLFYALNGGQKTADVMGDGDTPVKIPG